MTKATINNQHDYATLRVVYSKELRVNLTISRYATKCSGKGLEIAQMNVLLKAFDACRANCVKGMSYGQMLEELRIDAEKTVNPQELMVLLHNKSTAMKEAVASNTLTEVAPPKKPMFKVVKDEVNGGTHLVKNTPSYTQEELQAAFDKVKNSKDWKVRIDRTIPKEVAEVTMAAIIHFHGAVPYTVPHKNPAKVTIRSKGYAC